MTWSETSGCETSRSKKFGAKRPGHEASRSKKPGGETSWSKKQGAKLPDPKCQGVKSPGPKCLVVKRPGSKCRGRNEISTTINFQVRDLDIQAMGGG